MRYFVMTFLCVLLLAGCATVEYYYSLSNVEGPQGRDVGKSVVLEDRLMYEDELLRVKFIPGMRSIGVEVTNKTEEPISIIWEDTSYTDPLGKQHDVINAEAKIKRGEALPPTVIPPGRRVADAILPADYVIWKSSGVKCCETIMPDPGAMVTCPLKGVSPRELVGKSIKITLPVQKGNVRYKYSFIIEITGLKERVEQVE